MDSEQFDRWTQGLNARLSRRGLSGIVASSLATLGLAATTDAKKKKKKKKKKPSPPPPPLAPNTSCQNLTFACGNTAVCQCRLDKASNQVCENAVVPPDGINFNNRPCISNANCVAGTVCDAEFSVCATACAN